MDIKLPPPPRFIFSGMMLAVQPDKKFIELNTKVELLCTMFPAVNVVGLIGFLRDQKLFGSLRQKHSNCVVKFTPLSGYEPVCGYGTNMASERRKMYSLYIASIKKVDFKPWRCQNKDFRISSPWLDMNKSM